MIKKILAAIVILGVIGGFIYYSLVINPQKAEDQSGVPRNAFPVEIEESFVMTIITDISVKGSVQIIDRHVMYPKSNAKISKVNAKVGDAVVEGDVLVEYEEDSLQGLRDQMRELALNLESAQIRLDSTVVLPSRTELMQAEMGINQSEANINQANKAITDINLSIDSYGITIDQLKRQIESTEKTLYETRVLYDVGAAAKSELESVEEAIIKLNEQLLTTEMQRDNTVLSLANAYVALSNAEAALELSREQYQAMLDRPNDETVQNQLRQNRISVDQIKLKMEQLQKQINDFTFIEKAPVSGTVLSKGANPGEYSSAGRPLFEIADTSNNNLVIKIYIPEKEIAGIYVGQEAEITGSALGREKYTGFITKIYPVAEQRQTSNTIETVVLVDIMVSDDKPKLRSGYTVDAAIVTDVLENAVVVPLMSTLSDSNGENYVFIMKDDFTVEKRVVGLLAYSGMYVAVTNVKSGEQIIQSPPQQITEGIFVKPVVRQ